MDTPTMTPPPAFQPKPLTEAEVHAWLRSKVDASGIKELELKISSDASGSYVFATGFIADKYECEFGKTIDDAIEKFRRHMKTPEALAEQKRTQAAKLLAEAALLSPIHDAAASTEPAATPTT